jgi:hypothetical protein
MRRRGNEIRNPLTGRRKKSRSPVTIVFYLAIIAVIAFIIWLNILTPNASIDVNPALISPADIKKSSVNNRNDINKKQVDKTNNDKNKMIKSKRFGTLPSATTLLTKSSPIKESELIRLSDSMITSPNTVVTAYHRVPSKFKPGKYDDWMKNMLSLQDAMVIFTETAMVDQVKGLRRHALNRTIIVPLELNDLPYGTLYQKSFWLDQLNRDPEKRIHRSYELFWIWLSKSWCVSEAIKLNIFHSDLFVWSDIGCFREKRYNGKTMIQHREQVPPHEMIQMAHHKPNPPNQELFNDKYKLKPQFYHSGSQFAGYKDTWVKFHANFLETIDRFLEHDMIIVEDQAVLQSTCLTYPDLCAYVPFTEVNDNHYFGLRYVLHNGGTFKLWRHTAAIEEKAERKNKV